MSAREEVLARVRSALAPESGRRRSRTVPRDYRTATDDGLDQFLDRLAHYEARAIHTTPGELDATVHATLEDRGVRNVVTPDGVPEGWLSPKTNPLKDDPQLDNQALDDADGVLTVCALAIAQTGTIVLDGGPGMGRRALTLLPDYHLCVVRSEQIVSSVPEALARLDPVRPLTFISRPSATVDIEMVRVKGVHGPGRSTSSSWQRPNRLAPVRTQVGIVGAGPAGLTLAMLLQREGIECVVLEARTRDYVEKRVRAGLLEQNTVNLLRDLGVADRLDREGIEHSGIFLRHNGRNHYVDMTALTGRHITIYGQQEVVKDLIAALLDRGGDVRFEVSDVALGELDSDTPRITFTHDGKQDELVCDAIAGCDGFHGVSRPTISEHLTEYEYVYEFGWLGILAEARPATDELIYAWHERGFALYTMRSQRISRLYLQVPVEEDIEAWPDDRIWDELGTRLGNVNAGPILEKGITPMRSFVVRPMQHGRVFLAGDSAHIVPPTGAKGLNLAVNDVRLLAPGLATLVRDGRTDALAGYSTAALRRVWRAQDFSNFMTQMLHDLGGGPFERQLQLARLEYIERSEAAARSLAENYVGLPAEPEF